MKTLFNTIGVCLFLNVTTTSYAIPIESFGHGRSNNLLHIKPEERRLTFSEQFGFDALPVPSIKYGPLDFAIIFLEDEIRVADNEPLRVAMKRELNLLASDGEWLRVPNGWLWRVEILCESSLGVNLHFTDFNLPEGAKMIVYNVHDPSGAHGPFTGTGDFGTGEVWTASIGTDRIRIEYLVPLSNQRVFSKTLPFFLADLHDVYIDFFGGENGRFGDMSCYEDPVCHAEWVDPAKGMALIVVNNSWACSGGLLATYLQDETPYYYTAHHCVESTSEANSLVFYFGYQALTCGGSIDSGTIVSGGAELVDASPTSSDGNTLVMIRREIPREIYFPGWTMGSIALGTNTTGLHFPNSSYLRISMGDYVGGTSTLAYQDWTPTDGHGSGSAEPGSSGSHIFRDSDQRVYGALLGGQGTGGCANPDTIAAYNKLSASGFQGYLIQGADDDFEDNDVCADATEIANGSQAGLVIKSTDEDWYYLSLSDGQTLHVSIGFTDINGDIDVELYSGCESGDGGEVVASSQSNSDGESISYTNDTGMTDDFYLRIYLAGWGTRNEYSLGISTVLEGACCFGVDGDCADVSESICNTVGGTWLGAGTNCDDGGCDSNNCPTDINGDGYVNVSDLLIIIDQWGLTDSPADLNFDGIVDVSDLLLVVGNWGPCE